MEAAVKIRLDSPASRPLLGNLEKYKRIQVSKADVNGSWYDLDEAVARADERLIAHYGEEMRELLKEKI